MQSAVRHYYNINKSLMLKLGMWPTQSIFMKITLPSIAFALVFSIGFLEFVRLSETWKQLTEDCECFIMVLLSIGSHIKLFIIVFKNKNIEHLLSLIDYHWRIFTHSLEVQIMHEYAIEARKITISYSVMIFSLMFLFMAMPAAPLLLDVLIPLNKSRPYIYLFDVDYHFDREKYYGPILLHAYVTILLGITSMLITDTIYMTFAHHACALFAAVGHRLENLTSIMSSKKNNCSVKDVICSKDELINHDNRIYRELVLILQKHQLSLQYVDMLESLFYIYSFTMIFLQFTIMSLLGLQILSSMDRKGDMIRYVAMVIGGFVHLFVLSYPGQEITDHSADIFYKAYNMLWYNMSRRSTQLLSIVLSRGLVPCTLTAGKMYILSMENYASVMQATLSYFTALSSFK